MSARRILCVLLILALTVSAAPAFAAKPADARIGALSCDRDYGFVYRDSATSKGVVLDVLKLVGESIGKKIVESTVDWALGDFINSIFGIESMDVEKKFDEVNGKLDEIKQKLDEMYQKLVVVDFRGTIQNRDQKYNELKPEVVSRMNRLLQADTAAERKAVVLDWADRSMMSASSGVTATTQWGNLISSPFGGYTYIQCYDGYARLAFPWEHDGYDFREAAREADLTLYIDACVLTGLYYNLVIAGEVEGKSAKSEQYNIEAFTKQLESVLAYFGKPENQVVRDNAKNQCQITGLTDFAVYVNDTYEGYFWSDMEGYHRGFDDLMNNAFYTKGARKRRSEPLKSDRLKKLMAFYPGQSVASILRDQIGVQGVNERSIVLLDRNYKLLQQGYTYNPLYEINVSGIQGERRSFDAVLSFPIGSCRPLNMHLTDLFLQWEKSYEGQYQFVVVCTGDQSGGEPNADDMQTMSGTITKVTKKRVTLRNEYDLDVVFDITSATVEGTCAVGLEADVLYHENDDGSCAADVIRVAMPVTLSEEQTVSGVVTKQRGKTLAVKGSDGAQYEFELSFNTALLADIAKNTPVTVTYQPGDDGKLYVMALDKIEYEKPVFAVTEIAMTTGDTRKLGKLTDLPGTWTTQDETVAKIVKGQTLKAVGAGSTNLLFTVGAVSKGETARTGDILVLPVTVAEKGSAIRSLAIKPKKATVKVGGTLQLTATWKPQTASETTLTWVSSDESVATVDDTGLVTGVAAGKAIITVAAANGVQKNRAVLVQ